MPDENIGSAFGEKEVANFRLLLDKGIDPERAKRLVLQASQPTDAPPSQPTDTPPPTPTQQLPTREQVQEFATGKVREFAKTPLGRDVRIASQAAFGPTAILSAIPGAGEFGPGFAAKLPSVIGNVLGFLTGVVDKEKGKKLKEAGQIASHALKEGFDVKPGPITALGEESAVSLPTAAIPGVGGKLIAKAPILAGAASGLIGAETEAIARRGELATGVELGVGITAGGVLGGIGKGVQALAKTQEPQEKLFKSLNPTVSKLTKARGGLGQLKKKANRANEIILLQGHKPVDTASRVDAHQKSLRNVWGAIQGRLEKAGDRVSVDFGRVGDSIDDYLLKNPALEQVSPSDFKSLSELRDSYIAIGNKDVLFAENAKQIINGKINNWGEGEKVSAAVSSGLKKATANIGEQLDEVLSKIPGEFQGLKNDYGALAETLPDAMKASIVNDRKKGKSLVESFSRIEGLGDIIEGTISIFGKPDQVLPKVGKGIAKVAIGQKLEKLRDPDILTKEGFEELSKLITIPPR